MPDTEHAGTIHPEALKAARNRQGMTQKQLADAIGCRMDTVSRWERGTSRRVRSHLRQPLCKVLRVRWETLTEPPNPELVPGDTAPIKATIGADERNSLYLVAERYCIRPDDVLALAPLLFFIVAERSLIERQRRLEGIRATLDGAKEQVRRSACYLGDIVDACHSSAEKLLLLEKESIEKRDVFGQLLENGWWDGPFVDFVQDFTEDFPKDEEQLIGSYGAGMLPWYRMPYEAFRECTGLAEDDEQGERLIDRLLYGDIDLAECLRVKRNQDEDGYRRWLSDALAQIEEEEKEQAHRIEQAAQEECEPTDSEERSEP